MRLRTLSTALWCSVMPSVQHSWALSGLRGRMGELVDRVGGDPGLHLAAVERPVFDGGVRLRKPVVARSTNDSCTSPAWMISRVIVFDSAMSVPVSMPSQVSVPRGL